MTKLEMTEIFSAMMLAWPNAELFKGGLPRLAPTVSLWAAAFSDVDFWTGLQALNIILRECKFPPTIADFRAAADRVNKKIKDRVDFIASQIKTCSVLFSLDELDQFPIGKDGLAAIERMGGVGKLFDGGIWHFDALETAYRAELYQTTLESTKRKLLQKGE